MSVSLSSGFRLYMQKQSDFSPRKRGENKVCIKKSRTKANLSKKSFSTILKQVQKLIHFSFFFPLITWLLNDYSKEHEMSMQNELIH